MKFQGIHRFGLVFAAISVFVVGTVLSDEKERPSLSAYGFWLAGQVVKGTTEKDNLSHQWLNSALTGFALVGKPSPRLTVTLRPEFRIYYPIPELFSIDTRRMRAVSDVREVNGNLVFGDIGNPYAELRLGIFSYKYNPDVKDLGEYLFRTGTYPPFAINNFDFPMARLCGMQFRVRPLSNLSIDALFLSELEYYPLYDFSLAFLAEYKLLNAFNFGAGVDFARLFPIDPRKSTTPDKNPLLSPANLYVMSYKKNSSDTGYSGRYTFKATKFMGRVNFDVKAFLGGADFFGKEDLKLYGEIALTGMPITSVPDSAHPDLYGDISRLMPMVAGFNVPTFKLLDMLSVEVEYFPSRMPNDYGATALHSIPLSEIVSRINPPAPSSYDPDTYKQRDFGWSVYYKKAVTKGVSIVGQFAYNHMRLPGVDGYDLTNEAMSKKGNWAWVTKVQFSF